jgi:Zn-finger nucleic acid-binding protein
VRLIACSSCHAQYDVTDVVADSFPCRCGETLANEPQQAVDAEIHRCGACGALVQADSEACAYCGSAIVRDPRNLSLICPECFARNEERSRFCTACGVGFQPETVKIEGHELPCPVCTGLMPPRQVGGVGVNECPICNGLWVPEDRFDRLVSRAIEARRDADPAQLARLQPRARGANPAQQRVQYRKCPECEAFMLRRNFRKSSGVIIDRCQEHGTWLDADELEQIAGFLLGGGDTSQTLLQEERAVKQAEAKLRLERIRSQGGFTVGRPSEGMASSLLEVFVGLLK